MAQYMSWSGVTSMGYGSITLVKQSEIWFGIVIILVQIVFYGTRTAGLVPVPSGPARRALTLRLLARTDPPQAAASSSTTRPERQQPTQPPASELPASHPHALPPTRAACRHVCAQPSCLVHSSTIWSERTRTPSSERARLPAPHRRPSPRPPCCAHAGRARCSERHESRHCPLSPSSPREPFSFFFFKSYLLEDSDRRIAARRL